MSNFCCFSKNHVNENPWVEVAWKPESFHDLYGNHLEADARVEFHALHTDTTGPGNIVICANNNNILVILQPNAKKFQIKVLLDPGLD